MAPVIPFIPLIASGVGALGGFLSRPRVPEPSALETEAFTEQIAAGKESREQRRSIFETGKPALDQATSFFGNLVSGDKSVLAAATAPEQAAIGSTFRGARQNILETGRGGTRDLALANLSRDRASTQASLIPAVRSNAAAALANIGGSASSVASGNASSVFGQVGNALQTGRINQFGVQAGVQQTAGAGIGNFLFDLAKTDFSKAGGKPGTPPFVGPPAPATVN